MTTSGHTSAPGITTQPFPASRKIFVEGRQPAVRVPMREITLTPTKSMNGDAPVPNEPRSGETGSSHGATWSSCPM